MGHIMLDAPAGVTGAAELRVIRGGKDQIRDEHPFPHGWLTVPLGPVRKPLTAHQHIHVHLGMLRIQRKIAYDPETTPRPVIFNEQISGYRQCVQEMFEHFFDLTRFPHSGLMMCPNLYNPKNDKSS